MSHEENIDLNETLADIAQALEKQENPAMPLYAIFLKEPEKAFELLDFLLQLDEEEDDASIALYSAAIFAFELCVSQLKSSADGHNKLSEKRLGRVMDYMADHINSKAHSIAFWLPVFNAFYEAQVDLSQPLKEAYLELAGDEQMNTNPSEEDHLQAIGHLLEELADLSDYEIAENFFSQSYAMPAEFFGDLVLDLFQLDSGHDIAILTLLHPAAEVRDVVIHAIDHAIDEVTLSSRSLNRLRAIKHWYPAGLQQIFDKWIKIQRKKGVVFLSPEDMATTKASSINASEVDGSGSQGLFIHTKDNRLCGILLNDEEGIKDAWITPPMSEEEVKRYYHEAFDEMVTLRRVDYDYFKCFAENALAQMVVESKMVNLHFLEMQELLGLEFEARAINIPDLINQLGVEIQPFTEELIEVSLKRSKSWLKTKSYTESWFEESPEVDKLVNRQCSIIDGTKVCDFEKAMASVLTEVMEKHRDKWLFHFLWLTLWLKSAARKNEKSWIDSFIIAYVIHENYPLESIPVMKEICFQTVVNSVETMHERKTHLSQG